MLIIQTLEKVYLEKYIITDGQNCHSQCSYLKCKDWCSRYVMNIKEMRRCRLCRKKYKDTDAGR
jgi:hypothetical protein